MSDGHRVTSRPIFSSTIIPTVGRPTLGAAVRSVLDQDFPEADFEVIVVNDSGTPLGHEDWRQSARVRTFDVPRRERSVCRNTGAALAQGRYLHFLDDDDVLLPGALRTFWDLAQAQPAEVAWLYGGYQAVDNDRRVIREFRPGAEGDIFARLVAGESIPLQASMLENRRFFLAGGFDPVPDVLGVEDRDLGRRMAAGAGVAGTGTLVAQIRVGEEGSTTNWRALAEGDRVGREKALGAGWALPRLLASAQPGYWRGRVARAYAASTLWNIKHGRVLTAVSRSLAGLRVAGWSALDTEFWRGLRSRPS